MLKDTPKYRASQIIRLNDYPQITIDCTLAETLRANAKNDEISRLGWGVSYICQRLWHDNPKNAKELGELIYVDSKSQDFIDSIPNATMQTIVKDILPRVEMREFDKKYKKIAEESHREYQEMYREFEAQKERYTFAKEDDKDKTIGLSQKGDMINFYIELDWDEFYMKFPLIENLKDDTLHIRLIEPTCGYQGIPHPIKPTYSGKILTNGFLTQIQNFINSKKDIIKEEQETKFEMQVSANLLEIARNPKGAKKPKSINKILQPNGKLISLNIEYEDISNAIFSIASHSQALQENEKLLNDIKPSDLRRHQMQYYGISDSNFGLEYKLSFEEKSNQAIALYALSGKFQIYYVLDKFEVEKLNESEIAIYPTQIKAYIDDSFDFRDQNHTFNDNGSIKELGQPVGTWNYKEMRFDFNHSVRQMARYGEGKDFITKWGSWGFSMVENGWDNKISNAEIPALKKQQIYPLYNQDYQKYKKTFNKGLNFRVFSKDKTNDKIHKGFYILKVPDDKATQAYFKVEL